jgi:hypothetical protein
MNSYSFKAFFNGNFPITSGDHASEDLAKVAYKSYLKNTNI